MNVKKGDPVAPPPVGTEWAIHFGINKTAKGWPELVANAPGNARRAWDTMRTDAGPGPDKPTSRHHQLKGGLAYASHRGRSLPQSQIEVTNGGRIWYLLDEEHHTVWIRLASTSHPKSTD